MASSVDGKENKMLETSPPHGTENLCKPAIPVTPQLKIDPAERLMIMQSGVPLSIHLESSEVVALKPPAPLFLFAKRVSYLPHLVDCCYEHFKPYIQPAFGQPLTPFFDFEGAPLDWRVPIGVLFDSFCRQMRQELGSASATPAESDISSDYTQSSLVERVSVACGCSVALPWRLTVHFHSSTTTYLNRRGAASTHAVFPELSGWGVFEGFFMNSLKQAAFIINGSAVVFQRLAKASEIQLLSAARTGCARAFLECCEQLLPPLNPSSFKRIPVKIYICGTTATELSLSFPIYKEATLGDPFTSRQQVTPIPQKEPEDARPPSKYVDEPNSNREYYTLGDMLHDVIPQLFPRRKALGSGDCKQCGNYQRSFDTCAMDTGNAVVFPSTKSVNLNAGFESALDGQVLEDHGVSPEQAPTFRDLNAVTVDSWNSEFARRSCRIVVHGVEPMIDTPLFWLAATAPHMDLFLHVIVRVCPPVLSMGMEKPASNVVP